MDNLNYVIITDSNSELPLPIAKEYSVPFVRMPYLLNGVEYEYDLGEKTDFKEFFNSMKNGSVPSTTTYPPQHYLDMWEPYLKSGKDILFIAFSSKLSAAFEFVSTAAETARMNYPERRIELIDTLSISGGMSLLLYGALRIKSEGGSMDAIIGWVNDNIQRANHYFTVGDLVYLKRGGRISASMAMVGTMLGVKPMLTITSQGTVASFDKVKGRKMSIKALADLVIEKAENPEENICIILHADCEEDAYTLKDSIEKQIHFKEYFIQFLGPVLGTHAGPDTLAVFFMGKPRA